MLRVCCLLVLLTGAFADLAKAQQCGGPVSIPPGGKDAVVVAALGSQGHLIAWRSSPGGIFLNFVDSLGAVGAAWPPGGLRLMPAGSLPLPPLLLPLSRTAAIVAWSDFAVLPGDSDGRVGILAAAAGSPIEPGSVAVDTLTFRPRGQAPVGLVRQDDAHGLVILQDMSTGLTRALIKQVAIPGAPLGQFPAEGVVVADEQAEFPTGISPVACCTDDSSGCFILMLGTFPIDDFHFTAVFKLYRLLPDGSRDPRWPHAGLELTADGDEFSLVNELVPDGHGGTYADWTTGGNSPAGPVRVMAQHVDRDGTIHPGWEAQGKVAMPSAITTYQFGTRGADPHG